MFSLLYTWTSCLRMLKISRITAFLRDSTNVFWQATKLLVQHLYWFVIVDIILFTSLGDIIFKALKLKTDPSHPVGGLVVFLLLVINIVSFIITTGFILFIRKPDDTYLDNKQSGLVYLKEYFLRYIQLSFFFSALLFLSLLILLGLSITKFPGLDYLGMFIIPAKIFEFLVVFFWLDSKCNFRDILISCERACNFFVYNLPFIILLSLVGFGIDMGIKLIIFGYNPSNTLQVLLCMRLDNLGVLGTQTISTVQFVIFKYAKFITDLFFMTFVFVLYNRWKNRRYTESLFEE